jgi:ketol-acid reductoisomerase
MIKKTITIAVTSLMMLTVAQAKSNYGTVNGVEISEADVQMTMGPSGMQYATLDAEMKKRVIEMVVDRTLLTQSAQKSDITKTDEYKAQLEALKKGLLLDVWMKKMMADIEKGLTKEKLEEHFKKNASKYQSPKQLKARHILVKTEDEAKALVKELDGAKEKQAKFIELAKSKSTGPSGAQGGDLGWFELAKMVPEFSEAGDKLKKGEYTKTPVKTQFGYHLIMLDDRKEAGSKKFEEVEASIRAELGQQEFTTKVQEMTKTLRKDAKIELVTETPAPKPVVTPTTPKPVEPTPVPAPATK